LTGSQIASSCIYVADDVEANRDLLETILGRGGFDHVTSFSNGSTLLEAIARHEPDLIFLDLRMPIVDGFEVLRTIRGGRPAEAYLPVIVLTAEASPESRRAVLEAGANDYVTKPFDASEIMLRARNLLETRRLHVALRARNADLTGQVDTVTKELSEREREWADVAVSLASLEARETAESTAQAICQELSKISGLTSVMIVGLDAGGQAVPLAHDGFADVRIGVNRPLPKDLIGIWRDRVGTTPWIGPWETAFGDVMQRLPHDRPKSMAIIPLRTSKAVLGAMTASTSRPDGIAYLTERLPILESFAAITSALLAPGIQERQQRGTIRAALETVLTEAAFEPVFQPIVDLATGSVVGFEALTRFADGTRPDRRFADAAAVGLGQELESATLNAAMKASDALPAEAWLSLNISPEFLLDGSRLRTVTADARRPLVLEITEHVVIEDYAAFRASVAELGAEFRYAVDDAGAGFSSFRHILELRPDFVKLDLALVRDIDADEIRQALVAGIVYFARSSGCRLVAEGIESSAEKSMLQSLGVDLGQGYALGRPAPVGRWAVEAAGAAGAVSGAPASGAVPSTAPPAGAPAVAGGTSRTPSRVTVHSPSALR
jgi:EAL domain-containing protein (putative c-di-GMP-specific phosphodiesterase class I)/DNA-binding response OmpR family regulator